MKPLAKVRRAEIVAKIAKHDLPVDVICERFGISKAEAHVLRNEGQARRAEVAAL